MPYLCTAFRLLKWRPANKGSRIFFEKSFQNIWRFKKYVLSLHRFSALKKIGGLVMKVLMQIRI